MTTPTQAALLPFLEARTAVERAARALRPHDAEPCGLLESRGRILAESIVADRDLPPFPRATRDGYALRASDVASASSASPATLRVVAQIKAGGSWSRPGPLAAGEAAEVMTGAPAPPGADAVVMVEYTARSGDTVAIQRSVAAGENIVPTGAEARAGAELLAPGTRIAHPQIALAAAVGHRELRVWARPRVAILSTGDEVVDIAAEPGPNQIRNSNSYSLAAQIAAAGGVPVQLPIAPDELEPLRRLIQQGLASDLLLITGGVSVGKYDLVEQVLEQLGAEFTFTGAAIQPGRPAVFGHVGKRPFFGLPGNPVSTMVTFELFARPVLDALAGAASKPLRFLQARLKSGVKTKTGLTRFLPATLTGEFEHVEVEVVKWQGSGDLAATARADCYLVVPPDRESLAAGELVSILLVRE
jgi:molybdopterin molybdotransferase